MVPSVPRIWKLPSACVWLLKVELRLTTKRNPQDGLALGIHLKGKNPDLAKGQPFELNLPITGKVEELLVKGLVESQMEKNAWEQNNKHKR